MRAGSLKNQSQVLLKIDAYGPNMTLVSSMNILNFDGELVPLHVFSIAPCFTGEKNIISLKFPGKFIITGHDLFVFLYVLFRTSYNLLFQI